MPEPTTTSPASMGGPLSEAERIAEIRARLVAASKKTTVDVHAGGSTLRATATGGDRGFFVDGFSDLVTAAIGDMGPLKVTVADDEDGQDATLALHARDDIEFLLELVGVLEGQLATARELHKPERRYVTPDDDESSYDEPEWIAEAWDMPVDQVHYFTVCSHCGSIELGTGGRDYREPLWPCADAKALGLDGGGSDA